MEETEQTRPYCINNAECQQGEIHYAPELFHLAVILQSEHTMGTTNPRDGRHDRREDPVCKLGDERNFEIRIAVPKCAHYVPEAWCRGLEQVAEE